MPELLIHSLTLLGGIVLLLGGGDLLVRGAVTIARVLGVSPLLVGLTLVAFGTSAPELALNVVAAIKGNPGLSYGNIVGSNIANIGLILGCAAMIRPMRVHASVIRRELPMMIALSILAAALALHPFPTPWDAAGEGYSRLDGIILSIAFVGFLLYTLRAAGAERSAAKDPSFVQEILQVEEKSQHGRKSLLLAVAFVFAGLGLLVVGGQLSELGASNIARALGLGDEVIGLTVVAIATSLPELATSVIAAKRGHADIAVGNVVGSNIFNLSLVLGVTACVAPVPLPDRGAESLAVMLLLSILLVPMSRTHGRILSRFEAFVLLIIYAGSLAYAVLMALGTANAEIG